MRRPVLSLVVCGLVALASASALAQSGNWSGRGGQGPGGGDTCAQFSLLSSTLTAAPGITNGFFGVPQIGQTYTVAVIGPGTGTFRIVGDPAGAITYAGPTTVPGTLNFRVTAPPPAGAAGIGFFFDAGAGTVTVGASCGASSVPAGNGWGTGILVGLTGLVALAALFRRRKQAA